ncbi:hypothetical protein ACHOLT_11825 [Desulfitobacterium sp. Sab5]|uniref:hypothetical protein n=1 Tax=Desulfitobacterium nosdiversum TaxID=3375356 RepID=UPI003CEE2A3D
MRKHIRKLFGPFRANNNIIRPVEVEYLVEKKLKSVAGNIDVTVANPGFNAIIKIVFEFIGRSFLCRFMKVFFQQP